MAIAYFEVSSDVNIHVYHFTPKAKPSDPIAVMCHPTGFTSAMYASVVAHLRGINVFGVDIRSHGLSQRGEMNDWREFHRDIEAVFDELKKRTNQDKFIGVGISSGSSAHILNAAKNKDLYSCLFLCEPILFAPDTDLSTRQYLAQSARSRRSDFDSRDQVYERFKSKGALSSISDSALALYAKYGFKETTNGVTLACKKEDEEMVYLSGAANGVYEALSSVNVPSKVIYGQDSDTISHDFAHEIASEMGNATAQQMPGVGHFTLFEKPALGARMITKFLEEVK